MSRNIQSLLFGLGVGVVTWVAAPYFSADVDVIWWAGQIPGANHITGREFLASSLGSGAWIVSLINSLAVLERRAK
jgi:hypothetical protein